MDDKRNLILAVVLSALILFGWNFAAPKLFPNLAPAKTASASGKAADGAPAGATATATPAADGVAPAAAIKPVDAVLATGKRVTIDTPMLKGSINLVGARIDDLVLQKHQAEGPNHKIINQPARLFSPAGTQGALFAGLGWTSETPNLVPTKDTLWQSDGATLTPTTPVTLSHDNGQGQRFLITIAVDKNYMFTVQQRVVNNGTGPVALAPYSYASRVGMPKDPSSWTYHIGPMGVFDGKPNYSIDYKNLTPGAAENFSTTGGWIGFTDKYWLTALIPDQKAKVDASMRGGAGGLYQVNMAKAPTILQPGQQLDTQSRIFAGAKESNVLNGYMAGDNGVPKFDRAIDWGWFYWFEMPIFALLKWLHGMVGNWGVAIILLTVVIRALMFPVAQRQFASMAQMRIVQPKMKALQEKYKDDKPRLQQEMMEFYKKEKINPLAGCLPILLQIPVFYALYKVLMVAVELRHQPFALWIKDLSAPDPAHILNLFGYLDFTPPAFLGIGILAILLGVTMWAQFKLNPPPTDPIQQQMFAIMPWMMMFLMAPAAAGLLIYWITNNVLSIAQQQFLYSRYPEMKQAVAQ